MTIHKQSGVASNTWKKSVQSLKRRLELGEAVPPSRARDLREQQVKEEAELKLYRRAKEIWPRLSMKERNEIRADVRRKNSLYVHESDSYIEGICISLIKENLRGNNIRH